jgi:alcohol dehydrogenase class IV
MTQLPTTFLMPMETRSGAGLSHSLLEACAAYGKRGILVHGRSLKTSGALGAILAGCGQQRDIMPWQHPGGEPSLEQLDELLAAARSHAPDWIAAVGGGSVMDIAKAAAGLLEAPEDSRAYHDGAPIPASRIAFIAVPTTAGTGSEATMVSVLTNEATGIKKSIRHPSMLARLVMLDPDLLTSCPPSVIAASGLDALTQAIESFTSRNATPITDHLAMAAIQGICTTLEQAFRGEGGHAELLEGSYLAGLALSNARLGVVHGLAHPLGARFHLPHGLVCGVCLPVALAFNREAMGAKYGALCRVVNADIQNWVETRIAAFGILNPFMGKSLDDIDAIIEETLASGSTKANPRPVTGRDVRQLLASLTRSSSQHGETSA